MVAAQGTQPVRSSWEVDCEHSVDDLVRRIPLRHLQALDRDAGHTPIFLSKNFRSNRACFVPRCFRAVVDDFASREETHALWSHLEPQYGRPHAEEVTRGRSSHTSGEHFIGITAAMFPAGLLHNITSRMAAYLEQEHGARGLYVSHTNSRGEWRFYQNASRGREAARRRQAELIEGRLVKHGHIDAARPTTWHYTCLLYIGEHEPEHFAGGETLLIDEVERSSGTVRAGTLVEARRGRMLAFSSGAENVHAALEATYGYRAIMQIWFGCDERSSSQHRGGRLDAHKSRGAEPQVARPAVVATAQTRSDITGLEAAAASLEQLTEGTRARLGNDNGPDHATNMPSSPAAAPSGPNMATDMPSSPAAAPPSGVASSVTFTAAAPSGPSLSGVAGKADVQHVHLNEEL